MEKVKSIYGANISVWQESTSLIGLQVQHPQPNSPKVGVMLTVGAAEELVKHLQAKIKAARGK